MTGPGMVPELVARSGDDTGYKPGIYSQGHIRTCGGPGSLMPHPCGSAQSFWTSQLGSQICPEHMLGPGRGPVALGETQALVICGSTGHWALGSFPWAGGMECPFWAGTRRWGNGGPGLGPPLSRPIAERCQGLYPSPLEIIFPAPHVQQGCLHGEFIWFLQQPPAIPAAPLPV